MNVYAALLQTVLDELQRNPPLGIKNNEISILPEGKVPATMGQRWLTIHPTREDGTTLQRSTRRRRIQFNISLSQRMRDIPNDRFDTIAYMEQMSMVEVLDPIIPLIESNYMFTKFNTLLQTIPITPNNVDPPYDPKFPPEGLPPRYQLTDTFQFLNLNLDPKHLYPSDFLTRSGNDKEQLYDKIAGFQMSLTFNSPEYQLTYPPLQCKPPFSL